MGKRIERVGKYFSSIIIKNVGLFLAAGILTILFSKNGWMPNEDIQRLQIYIYGMVIPLILSYTAGRKTGGEIGGIAGAMAGAGLMRTDRMGSVMGAVLFGSLAGFLISWVCRSLEKKTKAGFEMLTKNLLAGAAGVIFLLLSHYIGLSFLEGVSQRVSVGVNWIVEHQMTPLISLFIEPGKVFFLNNGINHGILVPLGMAEVEKTGKSLLFLLETNPGPGLGVLLACYLAKKEERRELSSCMAVQFLGGIHEVYFPYVLSNLKLLAAVMLGGISGSLCFILTGAGAVAPASPGSILTLLLLAGEGDVPGIFLGVFTAFAVSFLTAAAILGLKLNTAAARRAVSEKALELETVEEVADRQKKTEMPEKIECSHIYFVCDAGLGSSAMGAALLRKKLREKEMSGIEVKAVSAGEIPSDAEVLVCQKSFSSRLPKLSEAVVVLEVESLVSMQEYDRLAACIQERNAGIDGVKK